MFATVRRQHRHRNNFFSRARLRLSLICGCGRTSFFGFLNFYFSSAIFSASQPSGSLPRHFFCAGFGIFQVDFFFRFGSPPGAAFSVFISESNGFLFRINFWLFHFCLLPSASAFSISPFVSIRATTSPIHGVAGLCKISTVHLPARQFPKSSSPNPAPRRFHLF